MATHGGCPILDGQKWAANLWVWNKAMPFGSSRFAKTTNDKSGGGGGGGSGMTVEQQQKQK